MDLLGAESSPLSDSVDSEESSWYSEVSFITDSDSVISPGLYGSFLIGSLGEASRMTATALFSPRFVF